MTTASRWPVEVRDKNSLRTTGGPDGLLILNPAQARGAKMALTVKNSTQKDKILNSAMQLFARQGYHGTSTREIARLADVSENTIFRHFDRKEDLFWTMLRTRCAGVKLRRDVVEGMREGHAPEVILPKIIEFFTDILNYSPELLRLIAVAMLEMQWKADVFCDECLTPSLTAINKYVSEYVRSNRIRNLDPTMVTAALTTMVLVHPWLARHTAQEATNYSESRTTERAYTAFWLDVLSPRAAGHEREAGPSPDSAMR